jgi:hypothetical protein
MLALDILLYVIWIITLVLHAKDAATWFEDYSYYNLYDGRTYNYKVHGVALSWAISQTMTAGLAGVEL